MFCRGIALATCIFWIYPLALGLVCIPRKYKWEVGYSLVYHKEVRSYHLIDRVTRENTSSVSLLNTNSLKKNDYSSCNTSTSILTVFIEPVQFVWDGFDSRPGSGWPYEKIIRYNFQQGILSLC